MGQLSTALIHAVWAAPFPARTGCLDVVWISVSDGRWTVRHTDSHGRHDRSRAVSAGSKEDALAIASGLLREACMLSPAEIDCLIAISSCTARL